jgi:triacylglycerol lipase
LFDEPKEGRVEFCSVHFGDVLRDGYRMKHLDDVNQPSGSTACFDTDPKGIFRTHVDRLENASL